MKKYTYFTCIIFNNHDEVKEWKTRKEAEGYFKSVPTFRKIAEFVSLSKEDSTTGVKEGVNSRYQKF